MAIPPDWYMDWQKDVKKTTENMRDTFKVLNAKLRIVLVRNTQYGDVVELLEGETIVDWLPLDEYMLEFGK